MLYCHGDACPLRADCYRHTQPSPGRDAFAALPYDAATGACAQFYSNIPGESLIRETAYYIWLRKGRPEHSADEDWREAYQSLCRSSGRITFALVRGV
ncbi:DUF2934 domain-containing protein [Oscillochloris sp. ZM17-4]|uniref:DUF2934 domain-containing protein n=1 Tax=Oscillochloris sp. ZM17-4 TaxID=2866714 RepID=UPI001C73AF16|nr:DUF2934 domain-containing protein [Oscillochloris sp. ZM17-4]MBX0329364.1 DUF2934 domain-containing protein [Oscillochloris sp. ZM17-4]